SPQPAIRNREAVSIIRGMRQQLRILAFGSCVAVAACGGGRRPEPPEGPGMDGRARALAGAYLEGFFARNPDQVTLYGVPARHHDKLPDNSLDALRAWQAK